LAHIIYYLIYICYARRRDRIRIDGIEMSPEALEQTSSQEAISTKGCSGHW